MKTSPGKSSFLKCAAWLLLAASVTPPALAASCAPSPGQEAEQLVRLHSHLMVITLSCRTGGDGQSLTTPYQAFTQAHLQRIKDAEHLLMQQRGGASKVDRMRTDYHNEISIKLAQLSPSTFCLSYRDDVAKAAALNEAALTERLASMAAESKSGACGQRHASK